MAHRGIDVSYETVRAWTVKYAPKIAANLHRRTWRYGGRRCKSQTEPCSVILTGPRHELFHEHGEKNRSDRRCCPGGRVLHEG